MNYNPYMFEGTVTSEVRVTLRIDDYFGHVWYKFTAEEQGKQALDFDFELCDCDEDVYRNDCDLFYVQEFDAFYAELKNDKGETLQIEGESAEFMNRLITAVEITDCYKEKSCYTCEEWDGHFKKCDHPDKPQSSADYCDRDNCCDLWVAKG
ncbi:MAG: hypothetical protein HFE75_11515 [Firmicutes bacterium]|nr:hypothetical protein [Bacillota bacterium]